MPHGITQCYLLPDRDDIPALTAGEAGTRLSDPGGCKAEMEYPPEDGHPSQYLFISRVLH